jgi:hypothetical protein
VLTHSNIDENNSNQPKKREHKNTNQPFNLNHSTKSQIWKQEKHKFFHIKNQATKEIQKAHFFPWQKCSD